MAPIPEDFRPEHRGYFHVLRSINIPNPLLIAARLLMLSIIVTILFMIFAPWVQNSFGTGTITALNPAKRLQPINALVPGRVKHWYVRDGSKVKKGDPIVELVDNDPQLVSRLEAERDARQRSYDVAKIAAETALIDYERKKQLFAQGLSSRRDFEQAKIRVKELEAKVAEAQAKTNKADVNLSRQSIQIVRAPEDGIIVKVEAGGPSTLIKSGQMLTTFVPDGAVPAAEIYISGLDAPLVFPGRKVRVQFEGWPAVQFSGWPSVAIGTFGGVVAAVDPSVSENGKFRVLVLPDPDDLPWPDDRYMRFGSQARGWILLDTVRVGYELWRQLNNFPPNNTVEASAASFNKAKP